jgi:endonuclease YncB( thermonuclease family)
MHLAYTVLLLVSALATASERPAGVPYEARWVKVDRITDGDTIVLMDRTRVRLHGIDAPERDQPYGPMATAALEDMVEKSVYVVEVDTDRYGHIKARNREALLLRRNQLLNDFRGNVQFVEIKEKNAA